ncbi:MAG: recombinase RecT [Cetobacterium sp.]|uniref:recombinase RecT n=1 Tax=Cetobacterium sp. TaxID=2071632 RepID=UPI003EE539B7
MARVKNHLVGSNNNSLSTGINGTGIPQLQDYEPQSIINSAITSATLDLPIEKNLGYAYIVPYKDKSQF